MKLLEGRPLWEVATGIGRTLTGHAGVVRSVAFSPDGKLLVSASVDKTARLWMLDALPGLPVQAAAMGDATLAELDAQDQLE